MNLNEITYNKFFNLLYSLENIEIDCIDNLLTKYHYFDLMNKYYQNLDLGFDNILTMSDIDNISALIKRNDLQMDLTKIYDYFMVQRIYQALTSEETSTVDFETFKTMIINMVQAELIKMKIPNPRCEIIPNSHFNWLEEENKIRGGEAIGNIVRLNELTVKWFYEMGNTALIKVIYHEIRHIYQEYYFMQGTEISPLVILEIQDTVLKDFYGQKYVAENYENLSYEKDAYLYGEMMNIKYLEAKGFIVNKKKSDEYIASLQAKLLNKDRLIDGVTYDIDTLFNKIIYSNPKILDKYPALTYLYKVVDGCVLPKDKEELKTDLLTILDKCSNQEEFQNWLNFYRKFIGPDRKQ